MAVSLSPTSTRRAACLTFHVQPGQSVQPDFAFVLARCHPTISRASAPCSMRKANEASKSALTRWWFSDAALPIHALSWLHETPWLADVFAQTDEYVRWFELTWPRLQTSRPFQSPGEASVDIWQRMPACNACFLVWSKIWYGGVGSIKTRDEVDCQDICQSPRLCLSRHLAGASNTLHLHP